MSEHTQLELEQLANKKIEAKVAALKNLGLPPDLEAAIIYEIRMYTGWWQIAAREYFSKIEKETM